MYTTPLQDSFQTTWGVALQASSAPGQGRMRPLEAAVIAARNRVANSGTAASSRGSYQSAGSMLSNPAEQRTREDSVAASGAASSARSSAASAPGCSRPQTSPHRKPEVVRSVPAETTNPQTDAVDHSARGTRSKPQPELAITSCGNNPLIADGPKSTATRPTAKAPRACPEDGGSLLRPSEASTAIAASSDARAACATESRRTERTPRQNQEAQKSIDAVLGWNPIRLADTVSIHPACTELQPLVAIPQTLPILVR